MIVSVVRFGDIYLKHYYNLFSWQSKYMQCLICENRCKIVLVKQVRVSYTVASVINYTTIHKLNKSSEIFNLFGTNFILFSCCGTAVDTRGFMSSPTVIGLNIRSRSNCNIRNEKQYFFFEMFSEYLALP